MSGNVYEVRFPDDFSTEIISRKARNGLISSAAANCAGMLFHGGHSKVRPGFFSGNPDRDAEIRQELINIGWIQQGVASCR